MTSTVEKEIEKHIEKLYNKARYETMLAFREAKARNEYKAIVARRERQASVWRKWGE